MVPPDTTASARPTRTEQQLAALDADGNPHRPDEPDPELATSARIAAGVAALARAMRARPFLTLAVGVTLGFVLGAATVRARAA